MQSKTSSRKIAGSCADVSLVPRIMIERVSPQIDEGRFPVKRVVGESVVVRADVFADGHDQVSAVLLCRPAGEANWKEIRMKDQGNDLWMASFTITQSCDYIYTVRGYINDFLSWRKDFEKRVEAGQDVSVDLKIGGLIVTQTLQRLSGSPARELTSLLKGLQHKDHSKAVETALSQELLGIMEANLDPLKSCTYSKELRVQADDPRARFSAWYEFFPRSWSLSAGKHGTFKDCQRVLPEIARMGFDVVYFPPIHPIGLRFRKGKNNATSCQPDDVGCPWAIGNKDGGHKAVHPDLGTIDDFRALVASAASQGLSVALDIAFQCSPDHPYVVGHPEWFKWRPDGTVQYAENPPKKYEDVLPFNFDTSDRDGLWKELKSIFLFWAAQGVTIFRVDNPHTKPFEFWDWVIAEVRKEYPRAVFLAEAFTRPKVMYRLAKGGFNQSYTYFTWRNTKKEFEEYLGELSRTEVAEFFRPNFWPNTPDIFPEQLQYGGRPAYIMRAVLASTMSSNYGIYGPAFELCLKEALPGREEYLDSEKYELRHWDWDRSGNIKDILSRLNAVRRENPALQLTRNIRFCRIENENLLAYYKATGDYGNIIIVIVNLDPYNTQSGWLTVPMAELGIKTGHPYTAEELLSGQKYLWQGERIMIQLDPQNIPAHIIRVRQDIHREQEVDYYM